MRPLSTMGTCLLIALGTVACSQGSTPVPADTEIPAAPTEVPTPEGVLISSGPELVGIYHAVIPGVVTMIIELEEDGLFQYGNSYNVDELKVNATAHGEWWFEDGMFHIVDILSTDFGRGWDCEPGIEGTYRVYALPDGRIVFEMIDDPCIDVDLVFPPNRPEHLVQAWLDGPPPVD